jgi:hypothetical protein
VVETSALALSDKVPHYFEEVLSIPSTFDSGEQQVVERIRSELG